MTEQFKMCWVFCFVFQLWQFNGTIPFHFRFEVQTFLTKFKIKVYFNRLQQHQKSNTWDWIRNFMRNFLIDFGFIFQNMKIKVSQRQGWDGFYLQVCWLGYFMLSWWILFHLETNNCFFKCLRTEAEKAELEVESLKKEKGAVSFDSFIFILFFYEEERLLTFTNHV